MTEQIDLLAVRKLIDCTRQLQEDLADAQEQLRKEKNESEAIAKKLEEHAATSDLQKQELITKHKQTVADLEKDYKLQLNQLALEHTVEIKKQQDELMKKNSNLLSELQESQRSNQAMIDRIRGITT